jgi:hypothetical protein
MTADNSVPAPALTRDNTHLSRPTMAQLDGAVSVINGAHGLPDAVASLVCDSLAPNTRRAYLSDLAEFERWGGAIPASAETVAAYLAARADALAVATLVRHLASISKAHEARGLLNPTRSELVRATLRGIKRTRGCAQRQAKALLRDDLLLVLDAMGDGPKDMRDRALLLIGFAGALRRSELVALDVSDIEHPPGHHYYPAAIQDRSGWPGPQDWNSVWSAPMVPGRCLRCMVGHFRHRCGAGISGYRPPCPRAESSPFRRGCVSCGARKSSRCRVRTDSLFWTFAQGWVGDKRRASRPPHL